MALDHLFRLKSRSWRPLLLVLALALAWLTVGARPAVRASLTLEPSPARRTTLTQTTWPTFGFDAAHTHFNPAEHVLSPATVSKLTLDWIATVGAGGQAICSTPAVANGMLYINDASSMLDAFDTRTGTLQWQHNLNDAGSDGCASPTVVNGVVYIGTGDTHAPLIALHARTGRLLWSYSSQLIGLLSTPTVVNGVVYVENGDGMLYAFTAQTGTLLWSGLQGAPGDIQIGAAPAVANGVVYAALSFTFSSMIQLDAYNAKTGALLWHSVALMPISQYGATTFYGAPVVANGLVYISADPSNAPEGGVLDAVNAQTGAVVWSDGLHLGPDQYPPVAAVAVANGVLYVGSQAGILYAVNALTGQRLWHFTSTPLTHFMCTPVVANGVVYVSDSGYPASKAIFALDAQTGKLLWSSARGVRYGISSVVVVNGVLYAAPWYSNYLYAFHLPGKGADLPSAG